MSQLLSPTVADLEPLDQVHAHRSAWTKWPKWIVLFVVMLWLADAGISLLIQHTRLRGKLTERLEAAFGRPVEVGNYEFSLWDGPALRAQSVTVAEDPRFGHEYFLHTESLTVRLLWSSLLRGRIGLGTLSLTQPSLNLVRNPQGDWNISEWLPAPAQTAVRTAPNGIGPRFTAKALSFRRIEIDAGRINFKRSDEKLPYAFTEVSGAVEAESQSRWRIDLDAAPWRAATLSQQAGTLHLAGDVGGTSSRLLPASLQLSWTDASLQDVLRLARGDDSGLRGFLGLTVAAATVGETWNLQARAELRQVHRWDLALRSDNPSLNMIAKMQWNPHLPEIELTDAIIEAPHSNAHAAGSVSWGRVNSAADSASAANAKNALLRIVTSTIDLQDALAWARAFRSGISDDIGLRGQADVQMSFAAWPPTLDEGSLTSDGAELSDARVRVPVRLSPVSINYAKKSFSLSDPVTVSFGDDASALRIYQAGAGAAADGRKSLKSPRHIRLTGKIAQVGDVIATASLFGWNLSRGWDVAGPVMGDLQWPSVEFPWQGRPVGFAEWGVSGAGATDGTLRAPFLNQPVGGIAARVDFKPGATHVALTSAQAFGARWNGTFDRRDPPDGWRFALSADQLDVANLNAWLNPLSRENFLDRMLPFLNPRAQTIAAPDALRAAGHIVVNQFTLAPLVVNDLAGDVTMDGRDLTLTNASGHFFGGTIDGSFHADLQAVPAYRASVDISRANLSPLLAASPDLASLTADSVSGTASFESQGGTRSALLAALTCNGKVNVNDLGLGGIDLANSLSSQQSRPGTSAFRNVSGAFSCSKNQIALQDIELLGSNIRIGGSGTVDFSRNLDLRLHVLPDDSVGPRLANSATTPPGRDIQLTGTLASPQIGPIQSAPSHRVR